MRSAARHLRRFAVGGGVLYVAFCGLLYAAQGALIYAPTGRDPNVPSVTMARGEDRIVVSVHRASSRQAVLYVGGNGEDVSQSLEPLERAFPGAALYAMHDRSYGGSTGVPTERALVADATRLYTLVAAAHPRVTVVGRSLGSGIAVQVAAVHPAERLVLVTPYASIAGIAATRFPFAPTGLLLRDRYDSARIAGRLRVPTTLVLASDDRVVPRESSLALAQAFAPGVARVVVLPGTGHNSIAAAPGYVAALAGTLTGHATHVTGASGRRVGRARP